jgi:hypothetical protein
MADTKSLTFRLARKRILGAPGVAAMQAGFTRLYDFDALNDAIGAPELVVIGQRDETAATAKKSRVR